MADDKNPGGKTGKPLARKAEDAPVKAAEKESSDAPLNDNPYQGYDTFKG